MVASSSTHFNLWHTGSQQVSLTGDGERVVLSAGLVSVRAVEKPLRIIANLAARLPDPRSPKLITHSVEAILTQEIYQSLAGFPDCSDAQDQREDPLFKILADLSPDAEQHLASGSTLARFHYAYTRREAELPLEERPVLLEVRAAQTQRLKLLNDYLPELFVRTRATPPTEIILDFDASDDPVHGQQALSGYHGYYQQHQYLPLFVFDGHTGFPLAAWLRPGTVHASLGAVEVLDSLVRALRKAWPNVSLRVRADNGFAVPELYEYCERENILYTIGYASNAVLERLTENTMAGMELLYSYGCYRAGEPEMKTYLSLPHYQAETWSRPRRIVAKLEITPQGSQRRFVVTNEPAESRHAEAVYKDVYVQRGRVPEQPIGELKNGLQADRLSACGFCANSFRLLVQVLAYAIVVIYREALAPVAEVATATVSTLRQRLWQVGAILKSSVKKVWLHFSETWRHWELWTRVWEAVQGYVRRWQEQEAERRERTRDHGASVA